jgi:hypothetical protein
MHQGPRRKGMHLRDGQQGGQGSNRSHDDVGRMDEWIYLSVECPPGRHKLMFYL